MGNGEWRMENEEWRMEDGALKNPFRDYISVENALAPLSCPFRDNISAEYVSMTFRFNTPPNLIFLRILLIFVQIII